MIPSLSITNIDVDPTSIPPNDIDGLTDDPFVHISVLRRKEDHDIVSPSIISVDTTHFNEIL